MTKHDREMTDASGVTNGDHASIGEHVVLAYVDRARLRPTLIDRVPDLLADLCHLAHREGMSPDAILALVNEGLSKFEMEAKLKWPAKPEGLEG